MKNAPHTFVLCEGVRPELNGKYTLFGVYGRSVVLFTPPPTPLSNLTFFFGFPKAAIDGKEIAVRLRAPGGKTNILNISGVKESAPADDPGTDVTLILNWQQPKIEHLGNYLLELRIEGRLVFKEPIEFLYRPQAATQQHQVQEIDRPARPQQGRKRSPTSSSGDKV